MEESKQQARFEVGRIFEKCYFTSATRLANISQIYWWGKPKVNPRVERSNVSDTFILFRSPPEDPDNPKLVTLQPKPTNLSLSSLSLGKESNGDTSPRYAFTVYHRRGFLLLLEPTIPLVELLESLSRMNCLYSTWNLMVGMLDLTRRTELAPLLGPLESSLSLRAKVILTSDLQHRTCMDLFLWFA